MRSGAPDYLWRDLLATMMKRFALIGIAAVLITGCSTDLDINAPYKEISVVYGLLNQRDSVHLVKVNKAFLGEGDAYAMALVADSNEYRNEDVTYAKVFWINASGTAVDSFPLRDTLITNREPGTFNAPVQRLFTFTTPFVQQLNAGRMFLHQDGRYELRLQVRGNAVSSSTAITNDFTIDAVDQDTTNNSARVNLMNAFGTDYGSYEFNWRSRANGKRYVVSYRFRYDEVTGTDTVRTAFIQQMGTRVSSNSANIEPMAAVIGGEAFFSSLAGFVKSNPNWGSVDKRIFRGLDFLISVANDDFHTYLTLTEPVSGIIEDRPAYSNIDGAFGVWGSRYTKNANGKRLSSTTLQQLTAGQYTGALRFCSALDPGGVYSCN